MGATHPTKIVWWPKNYARHKQSVWTTVFTSKDWDAWRCLYLEMPLILYLLNFCIYLRYSLFHFYFLVFRIYHLFFPVYLFSYLFYLHHPSVEVFLAVASDPVGLESMANPALI